MQRPRYHTTTTSQQVKLQVALHFHAQAKESSNHKQPEREAQCANRKPVCLVLDSVDDDLPVPDCKFSKEPEHTL